MRRARRFVAAAALRVAPAVVVCSALVVGFTAVVRAQQTGIPLQFRNVRLNSDPAFLLLDISPEKVTRPTQVSEAAISVRTASDNFEALPRSYALSMAPAWMASQPDERFSDWADAAGPGGMLRALSWSMAAHTQGSGANARTFFATGLRTSLRRSAIDTAWRQDVARSLERLRPEAAKLLRELRDHTQNAETARRVIQTYEAARGEAGDVVFDPEDPLLPPRAEVDSVLAHAWMAFTAALANDDLVRAGEQLEAAYVLAGDILQTAFQESSRVQRRLDQLGRIEAVPRDELVPSRYGLQVDMAAAIAWEFEESVFSTGRLHTGSGWLNIAWVDPRTALIAVARATGRRGARPFLDLGGRVTIDASQRVSPSLETVVRWAEGRGTDYSFSLVFETNLGRSNSLVFAFGRDFEPDVEDSLILTLQFLTSVGFDVWFGEG